MKIEELYPTDEEIRVAIFPKYKEANRIVTVGWEDRQVAKFAVDNCVRKIVEYANVHNRHAVPDKGLWLIKHHWQALKELIK